MPNVMGREFPYTPQGMAAAQQYSQAMGMRDGGPMGFRPLGYADGDAVNANRQVYGAFEQALTRLTMDKLAEYIYNNLPSLKSMAEENPARAAQLRSAMEKSGFEGYMRNLMQGQEQSGNLGRMEGQRLSDRDVGDLMRLQEQSGNLGRMEGQMQVPPQGMSDFPGYEPGTGDFYPPQQRMPAPILGPPSDYPNLGIGGAEEGDQYLIPGTPPPGAVAPIPYDPNEIEVANGGYISRKMNNGGLMSLRRR
jgi:hypothetical protein